MRSIRDLNSKIVKKQFSRRTMAVRRMLVLLQLRLENFILRNIFLVISKIIMAFENRLIETILPLLSKKIQLYLERHIFEAIIFKYEIKNNSSV